MTNYIINGLYDVIDPELGINIVDLGLIYEATCEGNKAYVKMTLTTPGCPLHDSIVNGVKERLLQLEEVNDVQVDLVFDPAWNPSLMSEKAKMTLFG
jgi:metal-sulfur cluster biosynthetic enzyme